MNYVLSYDISANRTRKIVSDFLIDRGFIRIQKSVFIGECCLSEIENMIQYICNLLNKKEDSIFCIPFDSFNYKNIFNFGKVVNYNIYNENIMYI